MESIDLLTERVHQAAADLIQLKKRNRQLASELDILRKELRDFQANRRELDHTRRNHDHLRIKLEKLQRKLSSYLSKPDIKKHETPAEMKV